MVSFNFLPAAEAANLQCNEPDQFLFQDSTPSVLTLWHVIYLSYGF